MPLSDRDYMRRSSGPTRSSWRPSGYEWFTQNPVLVLIVVNLIFFFATSIKSSLIGTLGLSPYFFLERPWTIVSNLFIHEGFGHIFGNMITLFFFGRVLNQIIGQNRFLAVYFIGGIVGNIAFLLFNLDSLYLVIGASGAVYAIAGVLVVMMPNLRVLMWFIAPMPLWVVVLVFFLLWSFIPGVAWESHLGGLLVGVTAGYIFRKSSKYYYLYR